MQDFLINMGDKDKTLDFKGKFNYGAFRGKLLSYQYIKQENLVLVEGIIGSHAYGLDVPESDVDYRGVYLMPEDMLYGMYNSQFIKRDGHDQYYYELARFIHLLMKNTPHALEMLSLDDKMYSHRSPAFQQLADNINIFITNNIFETYTGYAQAMMHNFSKDKRSKSAMHGMRVLHQLLDFYENDRIIVRPSPNTISYLRAIRNGDIMVKQIYADFNALMEVVTDKSNFAGLKDKHDLNKINDLVVQIRKSFYLL